MAQINKRTLTVSEAATTLGVAPLTLYGAIRRGEIRAVRIGRRVLVPAAAIEELLTGAER